MCSDRQEICPSRLMADKLASLRCSQDWTKTKGDDRSPKRRVRRGWGKIEPHIEFLGVEIKRIRIQKNFKVQKQKEWLLGEVRSVEAGNWTMDRITVHPSLPGKVSRGCYLREIINCSSLPSQKCPGLDNKWHCQLLIHHLWPKTGCSHK